MAILSLDKVSFSYDKKKSVIEKIFSIVCYIVVIPFVLIFLLCYGTYMLFVRLFRGKNIEVTNEEKLCDSSVIIENNSLAYSVQTCQRSAYSENGDAANQKKNICDDHITNSGEHLEHRVFKVKKVFHNEYSSRVSIQKFYYQSNRKKAFPITQKNRRILFCYQLQQCKCF